MGKAGQEVGGHLGKADSTSPREEKDERDS